MDADLSVTEAALKRMKAEIDALTLQVKALAKTVEAQQAAIAALGNRPLSQLSVTYEEGEDVRVYLKDFDRNFEREAQRIAREMSEEEERAEST